MKIRYAAMILATCLAAPLLSAQSAAAGKDAANPVNIYVSRARMQDAQGRHDLAAANWKQVLLLSPREPEALAALARYYSNTGNKNEARMYQQRLQAVQPQAAAPRPEPSSTDEQAVLEHAAQLASAHRYQESVALYRKVLGSDPTSGDWAVAYYQTEAAIPSELPHAIDRLRAIVAQYPGNPKYRLVLAKVLTYDASTRAEGLHMLEQFQGSPSAMEDARAAWRDALLWDTSSAAAQQSGAIYLERYPDANLAEALREGAQKRAHEQASSDPEEAEGYRDLQNGDLAGAQRAFNAMLKHPGQSARAHVGLGYVLMKQQDFNGAVAAFEQAKNEGDQSAALDKAYNDARYWQLMQLGNKAADAGDNATAVASYNQAEQLDSSRPEASEALAGLWVKNEQPGKALPILRAVIRAHSNRESAWVALANAELQAGKFSDILSERKSIPPAASAGLNQMPDYLADVASAQLSLGYDADAQKTLDSLNQLSSTTAAGSAQIDLKIAAVMLRQGRTEQAVELSKTAVRSDRSNTEAWQTLIRAEDQAGRDGTAIEIAENLPADVKAKLMRSPAYLIQAAAIYQKEHEYDGAAVMLAQAQQIGGQDLETSVPLQLQLASLNREMGRPQRAFQIYRQLLSEAPNRSEVWVGLLGAMHDLNHDTEALATVQNMPVGVRFSLRDDTGFLQVMASVYSSLGDHAQAMEMLRRVIAHYDAQGVPVPFAVNLQNAWLQLNAGNERGLSRSLNSLSRSADMTLAQKKQVEDLWVAWTIRRAEAALKLGGADQAFALLQAAQQVYPGNANLRHEISALYIRRGRPENAYKLYENFDWTGADVADFEGGIAAAAAADHWKQAEMWLQLALNQYPGNADLLRQAAQMEQNRGDIKKAEAYWASLRALNAPFAGTGAEMVSENGGNGGSGYGVSAAQHLAAMLAPAPSAPAASQANHATLVDADRQSIDALLADVSNTSSSTGAPAPLDDSAVTPAVIPSSGGALSTVSDSPAVSDRSDNLILTPASSRNTLSAPDPDRMVRQMDTEGQSYPAANSPVPPASAMWSTSALTGDGSADSADPAESGSVNMASNLTPLASRLMGSAGSLATPATAGNFLQAAAGNDNLAALHAQLSPWAGGGVTVSSRSGQAGFDQLTRVEPTMETSTVLGQAARLSVLMKPVMLETGAVSSSPLYSFGTSGTAPSGSQYQSGVGGEVQLATSHLEASLGRTPTSFLVPNTIGSLILSPTRSFSLNVTRAPVTETMLSYAGLKDPASGEIWGGVVATGGGIQASRGNALSGFYGVMNYSELTGRNVTSNTRFTGSVGSYWKAYENNYGKLTAGINMTGEHFAKNLQYFTYGQGGYFSPEAYMLVNAPITWRSNVIRNFAYQIDASIGVQNYNQGDAVSGSFLRTVDTNATSSANYGLNTLGSYRITPNWYVEGFLSANNAYDYRATSAGFTLRYMTQPHPVSESLGPTGLLDPKQIRPLMIP